MSLEFSRLNFKAKNQASTVSIFNPYASKMENKELHSLIEEEKYNKINELFNNLNIDEEEKLLQEEQKMGQSSNDYLNQTLVTNFDNEIEQMSQVISCED